MKVKAFAAALVLAGYSLGHAAQGPVTYAITAFDLNNGVEVSSSSSYKVSASVGDSFAAGAMSGGSYSLKSGLVSQVDIAIPKSSATSLSFGNQAVNIASAPLTVTISNYGASVLNVTSIIPTGDFAVSAPNCAAVASNGSCNVDVRFTPTVVGAGAGTLTFTASASISSVALSGNGVNTQTITFGATPTVAVNGTAAVTATASSGLAMTFASNTPTVCTVTGATVAGVSAGSCSITASQAGNGSYASASNTLVFNVAAAGSGGGGTGDVPLPAWALWLLAGGLIEVARRRRAA
jgi:hypothetical protein